jgi:hypothetical protein
LHRILLVFIIFELIAPMEGLFNEGHISNT